MSYNMNDIIYKKREGGKLSKDEIEYFIKGYVAGDIPDYQASALLMAIFFRGLDREETFRLTNAMRYSGDTIDLSSIKGVKVDKHSTGGVGDKTTLIVAPLASACGVPIAKMSGRGLGFTGGTVDKMESIPGFRTSLEPEEFLNQVNIIGMAVIGQTAHITPADKKLYALRDVTATVDNFGLIASSIMSKKLAAGSDAIVLDVKVGDGAFMENEQDAETLANLNDGTLHTFPLAGTRPRGKNEEEDQNLETELLKDEKELAEHNMLVDLGRNDLGRISQIGSVVVEDYMSVLRYSHVMHIGSTVRGTIRPDKDAVDAVDAILPAGTLSGAPKIRACQIIRELEGQKRGIYGGAIGYLDFGGNLDTCIAIRLAYKKNGRVVVQSGAGIVADSIPENEFTECSNKARAVVAALQTAEGGLR